jgi:hypothetical protein
MIHKAQNPSFYNGLQDSPGDQLNLTDINIPRGDQIQASCLPKTAVNFHKMKKGLYLNSTRKDF